MSESQKTFMQKQATGFFDKYMFGKGLDIGFKGDNPNAKPILESAIGIDLGYPAYDGLHLPFMDDTQDYVYSSHCLEHISDWFTAIKEWYRVTKPGGYIVTIVPHCDLYEKKTELPSRFNPDHKRFYNSAELLNEFDSSLGVNRYRVRHLRENDEGHDYNQPAEEHSLWLYEIELVIQKLTHYSKEMGL